MRVLGLKPISNKSDHMIKYQLKGFFSLNIIVFHCIIMESTKKLEKEANEVLEMLGGFGLLSKNASETDKKAFKKSYIEYKAKKNEDF
jgi:hypothetical protein